MKKHLFVSLLLMSCVGGHRLESHPPGSDWVEGASTTQVDLVRSMPGDEKIFVQVDLGLPERQLFMVDTGASVSAISTELADQLALQPLEQGGFLEGLGGMVRWVGVVLPPLHVGEITIHGVEAAVGVPGVPEYTGTMPVAGILGNNVWSRFVLTVDYPADVLELAMPGEVSLPQDAEPLLFDGLHCYALVDLEVQAAHEDASPYALTDQLALAIDTGARGVLLSGSAGQAFAAAASEGEEPIFGIGGGDDLPANTFMRKTRRIPIQAVELAGARIEQPGMAQWINFDAGQSIGPEGMPGLVGFSVLGQHRVIFDFPGRRLLLTESQREPRALDGHAVLLEQDRARYGDDPERGLYRARLLAWLEDLDAAERELEGYIQAHPDDRESRVLHARMRLFQGDPDGYWRALVGMDPSDLLAQGELLAAVNGHLLEGRPERARVLADAAVELAPEDPMAWLALADVLVMTGDSGGARSAINEVNHLQENPDGHLLRRARLALHDGDRIAAMAHSRRLLQLYPPSGFAIWFYTLLAQNPEELAALRGDLERAMARLHPEDRPRDFQMAAFQALGDSDRVGTLLAEGLQTDCQTLDEEPAQANCQAWYHALANQRLDWALERSLWANEQAPFRSDYLDTLALLYWRRGQLQQALDTELRAARLSPDDIYLLWQVDWIRLAVQASSGSE